MGRQFQCKCQLGRQLRRTNQPTNSPFMHITSPLHYIYNQFFPFILFLLLASPPFLFFSSLFSLPLIFPHFEQKLKSFFYFTLTLRSEWWRRKRKRNRYESATPLSPIVPLHFKEISTCFSLATIHFILRSLLFILSSSPFSPLCPGTFYILHPSCTTENDERRKMKMKKKKKKRTRSANQAL